MKKQYALIGLLTIVWEVQSMYQRHRQQQIFPIIRIKNKFLSIKFRRTEINYTRTKICSK